MVNDQDQQDLDFELIDYVKIKLEFEFIKYPVSIILVGTFSACSGEKRGKVRYVSLGSALSLAMPG